MLIIRSTWVVFVSLSVQPAQQDRSDYNVLGQVPENKSRNDFSETV